MITAPGTTTVKDIWLLRSDSTIAAMSTSSSSEFDMTRHYGTVPAPNRHPAGSARRGTGSPASAPRGTSFCGAAASGPDRPRDGGRSAPCAERPGAED
ncbi:hypothetical protein GCM10010440_26140 [Kitasatospora cinereorecta]